MVQGRPHDFSFLPGPEKQAPHLADRAWQKCIAKEEDFAILSTQARAVRNYNIITGEEESQIFGKRSNTGSYSARSGSYSARSTMSSYSGKNVDFLSLQSSRTGTAATTLTEGSSKSSHSSRSRASSNRASSDRSGRVGTSKRLNTAGSYHTSGTSEGGVSSALSMELKVERSHRKKCEVQLESLQNELLEARQALAERATD